MQFATDLREALPTLSTEADVLRLTKRQREVLSLLARGLSNKDAEATTKIHMAALLRGLCARNRTEAAFKAANLVRSTELVSVSGISSKYFDRSASTTSV